MATDKDTRQFLSSLNSFSKKDATSVEQAVNMAEQAHAGQTRSDGTPYFTHVLAVAEILRSWNADAETIIAGLLHDTLEDSPLTPSIIQSAFGEDVADLVEGVTKFTQADFEGQASLDRKIETLRKLFEVMRSDIRVAIIKLADRLHNVRTINTLPGDRRARFAKETMDIYYKLAYHLGMNDVRRELSDVCVPILYPKEAKALDELREAKKPLALKIAATMQRDMRASSEGPKLEDLFVREHSLFMLQRYLEGGALNTEDVFYVVAIAKNKDACYSILKQLHTLYRPVSGKFRDFIAAPSEGGYQSVHTLVVGPEGNRVQVRIRTAEMESLEHQGVLMQYFGDKKRSLPGFPWLQKSENLDLSTKESSNAFWEALQSDIFQEIMRVTVNGEPQSVPVKSTALDAIYARYGAEANRTESATVNGAPQSLATALTEDDVVLALLGGSATVSFDWLKFVSTKYARSIIVNALKEQEQNEKLSLGERLIQKELDHFQKGLLGEATKMQKQAVADFYRRSEFSEVVSMVGEGVIEARDVVFHLYPEQVEARKEREPSHAFPFHQTITGTREREQNILADLYGLARLHGTEIQKTDLRMEKETFELSVHGQSKDRLHFADFLAAVERQEGIMNIRTLLSRGQKTYVFSVFLACFAAILVVIAFLPQLSAVLAAQEGIPFVLLQIVPLLPILGVNFYMLRLLQRYVVRLRKEGWFLGVGFLMNMLGLLLVIGRIGMSGDVATLLPLISLFILAMLYMGFQFIQTESIFLATEKKASKVLSPQEWKQRRKAKMTGYTLRFLAVFIWGIEPVMIRYTPLQFLSPLLRVHIWALAGATTGFLAIFVYNLVLRGPKKLVYSTPYSRWFWIIVIANTSYNYFLHKSLLFTTATNVNLILSFAPVLALLAAFGLWRRHIPYLRSAQAVQQILIVFGLSALGGTMLIYNDLQQTQTGIIGDFFAMIIAASDVAFIMTNIYYVKYSGKATNTISLATHHFLWIAVLTFVFMQIGNIFFGIDIAYNLTPVQWTTNIGVGVLTLIGLVLTFEAFKRIDGLLAFLMLNLAPVIALTAELLFFNVSITPFFVLGAVLIIASSVFAEAINTRYERKMA